MSEAMETREGVQNVFQKDSGEMDRLQDRLDKDKTPETTDSDTIKNTPEYINETRDKVNDAKDTWSEVKSSVDDMSE